jgi:alpha-ketoglutarate-dependent taurine dioxygenase
MTRIDLPQPGRPYAIIVGESDRAPSAAPEGDLIGVYKAHGAVLLRGFSMSLDAFRDLTARYCSSSVFNESPDRDLLDADSNIQTVNGGVDAFPLHPELSREPWKPDVCFFYCIDAPGEGGETTLCDGVEIVRNLPPEVRAAFEGRRLRYQLATPPEVREFWLGASQPSDEAMRDPPAGCPYTFHRAPDGRVLRSFTRPALHKPMFVDDLAWGNFLFFARYYNGRKGFPSFENGDPVPDELLSQVKAVADRLTSPITWQPGDVIMIDNTRFMHGRNAIHDVRSRRIATFFGYLKFAVPDAEEAPNAIWRGTSFRPPRPTPPAAPFPRL